MGEGRERSQSEPSAQSARDTEREEEERRSAPSAEVIHRAIRREGENELDRPPSALFWSGLAAGMSMGFSLLGQAFLMAHLPEAEWRPLVAKFGYSMGFLFVILGRQQLFTENTLTSILPLMHRTHPWHRVARLWLVVLLANMAGTAMFALFMAHAPVLGSGTEEAMVTVAEHMLAKGFWPTFCGAIVAGWLIALMVWLLPFAESARVMVIVIVTYLIGLGGFAHVVAGSADVIYLMALGQAEAGEIFIRFWLPALLGNVVGGVLLVAAINHAQVVGAGGVDV